MTRLGHAWRAIEPEQRLAALAALGLFASMFLPWYSKTNTLVVHGAPEATATSLSAFQAFSFVEAAVLLVSAGVLTMLFARAEQRSFQLPGGDGLIVMIAGGWSALLIFYRLLDKPGLQSSERITATVGVEWGIFIALLLALALAYAGARMRALERPEPPLRRTRRARMGDPEQTGAPQRDEPGAPGAPQRGDEDRTDVLASGRTGVHGSTPKGGRRERGRYPPAPSGSSPQRPGRGKGEQLSFEDPPLRPEG
jgi:hypothetical protein